MPAALCHSAAEGVRRMGALWVGLGGALGAVARYWVDLWVIWLAGGSFPWGTLAINVTGSAAIGVWLALTPALTSLARAATPSHLFVAVGVLGGFTTFSAFSGQTLLLAQAGEWGRAAAYVLASVALCLGAVWLAFTAATALAR